MKILIGTTNPSKVNRFQKLLSQYNTEFITLRDIGVTDEPAENGKTPEENAGADVSAEDEIIIDGYRRRMIRFLAETLELV